MSSRLFHTPTPIFHHQARSLTRLIFHSSKVIVLKRLRLETPHPGVLRLLKNRLRTEKSVRCAAYVPRLAQSLLLARR